VTLQAEDFSLRTEPFRRELLAHCYRMLGSVDDAEDLVQETYLRAWRARDAFQGRSSVRTWLYQIATNACLTAMERRGRRPLPSGLDGAAGDVTWLQPIPDALVTPESEDPAAVAVSRENLQLALIAGLQYLPSRQRAVLLLCEVLAFPPGEVAPMLGTTTAAVRSALQRARATIHRAAPSPGRLAEPTARQARILLDRYIAAFEKSDADALKQVLREDAMLELPPSPTWFRGGDAIATAVAGLGAPGDWRMIPTAANGQPAAAAYLRGEDGVYRAYGIVVLTVAVDGIAGLVVFGDPGLFAAFGMNPVLRTARGGGSCAARW
jgi:RNA polymerase sigma-70 factor, ECF subfamily